LRQDTGQASNLLRSCSLSRYASCSFCAGVCARWKGRRALVVVTITNGMRASDQLHVRAQTIMVTNGRKCECVDSDTQVKTTV
jgi:hypothetical protein